MRLPPFAVAALLALTALPVAAEPGWRELPLPAESLRLTQEAKASETLAAADDLYAQAIRACPSNGPALFELGSILLRQNRPADSLKVFRHMNTLFPGDSEISVAIAIALTRLPNRSRDQLQQGMNILEQDLLLRPDDIEAWYQLSILRHLNGDYERAAEAARQTLALDAQVPINPETTTRYQQQETACNDALLVFSPLD